MSDGVRSFGLWIVRIDRDSSSPEPKAMIKAVTFSDAAFVTQALLPNSTEAVILLEWRQAPRRDPTAGSGLERTFSSIRHCFKLKRNVRSDVNHPDSLSLSTITATKTTYMCARHPVQHPTIVLLARLLRLQPGDSTSGKPSSRFSEEWSQHTQDDA